MTCQNCQRHVENALNTLPDTLAEVNLSAQNVTVWTKGDADEEVIRKAIRDAGYLPLRTKEKCDFSGMSRPVGAHHCPASAVMLSQFVQSCTI